MPNHCIKYLEQFKNIGEIDSNVQILAYWRRIKYMRIKDINALILCHENA